MNTATQNLEDDHVHILKLIDIMEHLAVVPEPDASHLETIVRLIRNFADGIHHAKEEDIFFPLLTERGFSAGHGPVAVMLNEHVAGRNFVKGLSDSIERYKSGNIGALRDIRANMAGYAGLLRSHIAKENNILFRMADKALSDSDQEYLSKKFREAEEARSGTSAYVTEIENMADLYNI